MQIENAAETMTESSEGIHALVIYSDTMTLREFWSFYIKKSIEKKNELVCLAPFYDTVDSVRKSLSEGHMPIDLQKYENDEKSLIIVDALEKYFDKSTNEFNVKSMLKANSDLVEYAESKLKKNGFLF